MITRRHFLKGMAAGTAAMAVSGPIPAQAAPGPPNIIFILADDIGYGDLGCCGATKVKTPNLDRIAREGVRFTDAHSTAAVCTPTRYSFLTGQYAWRNPDGDHILSGVAPLAIPKGMATVPSLLKEAGYATGVVGKWHLGLGTKEKPVDYNQDVQPGPLEAGFDYAFFFPATGDRVPCVFVENHRVMGLDPSDPIQVSYEQKVGNDPTGEEHPELLKIKADKSHSKTIVNGVSRIGYMSGGNSARWVDEDIADTFTRKAVSFIEQNKDHPFFLYFAPHDIHEPMVPHPRFRGTSECGWRGDVIHQLDWSVGEVLAALDRLNLAGNTLIIFTSDNGGAIKDTYDDGTNALHALQPPNAPLRGEKGTLYEGGHREPFLARWPGKISAGTTSDELIGLIDMLAMFTAVAGGALPSDAGPDSYNVLPALLGEKRAAPLRDHLVLQINGREPLAIRQGPWVLINKRRGKKQPADVKNAELYNLAEDLAEKDNVAKKYPEKVKELTALLDRVCSTPRSRT
ncbi:MAG TPA: arylsulfatase [Candidatus Hydrogenedentes bacterium]|nr:arylsulfatase [Candidatus Hydrogenedentota bacterium]